MPFISLFPKSVCNACAEYLSAKITAVLARATEETWWELITFSFTYIHLPSEQNGVRKGTPATHICGLLSSAQPRISTTDNISHSNPMQTQRPTHDLSRRGKSKCVNGDIKSTLSLLTTESYLATQSDKTLQALRDKHPHGSADN